MTMIRKLVENGTWVDPTADLATLFLLILVTILIECGFVWLYWRRPVKKELSELMLIIIVANFATGIVGFAIGVFFGL